MFCCFIFQILFTLNSNLVHNNQNLVHTNNNLVHSNLNFVHANSNLVHTNQYIYIAHTKFKSCSH